MIDMRCLAAALIACVSLGAPARAEPDRLSVLLGSRHFGAAPGAANGANPGLFLTWERDRVDLSAGVYRNSYNKTSVAVFAGYPLIRWDNGAVSAVAGLATYPGDAHKFAAISAMSCRWSGCRPATARCSRRSIRAARRGPMPSHPSG